MPDFIARNKRFIRTRNKMTTRGTHILDGDGQPFIPRGFNVAGGSLANGGATPDLAFDVPFASGMAAWKANTVRITSYCTDRYSWAVRQKTGGYGGAAEGDASVDKLADDLVSFWRDRGFVVMLEVHDLTYPGWTETQVAQTVAFWGRFAARWKHDDKVWMNTANEPSMSTSWLPFQTACLTAIRTTGNPNIVVLDTFDWAGDTGSEPRRGFWPEYVPELATKYKNVVLSMHNYGRNGTYDTAAKLTNYVNAVKAANIPMLFGEIGVPTTQAAAGSGNYQRELDAFNATLTVAKAQDIGAFWWVLNHQDSYDLHTGGGNINPFETGVILTPAGAAFKNYLASY